MTPSHGVQGLLRADRRASFVMTKSHCCRCSIELTSPSKKALSTKKRFFFVTVQSNQTSRRNTSHESPCLICQQLLLSIVNHKSSQRSAAFQRKRWATRNVHDPSEGTQKQSHTALYLCRRSSSRSAWMNCCWDTSLALSRCRHVSQ